MCQYVHVVGHEQVTAETYGLYWCTFEHNVFLCAACTHLLMRAIMVATATLRAGGTSMATETTMMARERVMGMQTWVVVVRGRELACGWWTKACMNGW